MPVFKNESNGTWYVMARYVNWKGERKQKCKRGFATKKEAQEWERMFQLQNSSDMDMSFEAFTELYIRDMKSRLKENTWLTKEHIIRTKILPYFGKLKISEISTKEVIAWQNEMLAYRDEKKKPYSQTYLKTLHNQLSAIFNHAVRYYELRSNPAAKAGNMGSEEHKEMLFWTKEEYKKFSFEMMDKPVSFYAFEMLYWCGIREGELLALTAADFDFEKETVRINKSYQRLHGEDVITTPKTKKSNRIIKMPKFLCEEMQEYLQMLYGLKKKDRIFTVTKSYLHHEMDRGAKAAGVKRIRIHDLRHSHISLLIDMGFSAVAIADRVGHESIDITYQYAHLFPSKQTEMADVMAFPQDYAAMMTRMMEIREIPKVVGIDIGGFTSDYLLMRSGRPDMDYCDSLEKGVITMYNDIISSINSEYDMLLEEADIDSIIKGKTQYYEEAVVQAVETMVQNFVTDLLNSIRERGIDTKSTYTVFIGGGAVLLERFLEQADRLGKHTFIRDMKANADGYDLLYRMTQAGV